MMKKNARQCGFTLLELLIVIALMTIIAGALYFSMNGAVDSWLYARDQLSLQKVLSETMDAVINGRPGRYGLKDSLEIIAAARKSLEFVPPWVDDTHSAAADPRFVYELNRNLEPGASPPITQVYLSETREWKIAPIVLVELEQQETTQVRLNQTVSEGSPMRFTYHPDAAVYGDVIHKINWDSSEKHVFMEDAKGKENISKNLFGVLISNMEFHYYTNNNQRVTDRERVDDSDIAIVTGVEVVLEAELGDTRQALTSFIGLRNSPLRTGYLSLRKDMSVPIPDSANIQTLMITNLVGISNNDEIQVEAEPRSGKPWRITVQFERIGSAKPVIKMYTIEYPPNTTVYTDYPNWDAELGLNLKILDPRGLYDYDDDNEVDDTVLLEGDVSLTVTEMNVKGAGLFVRP